MLLQNKH